MKTILTILFASYCSVCPSFWQMINQPNVITLLVDDLGYRDIGCYGGPVKTPVLDGLAADGVRFTDFHSGAPVCSPFPCHLSHRPQPHPRRSLFRPQ